MTEGFPNELPKEDGRIPSDLDSPASIRSAEGGDWHFTHEGERLGPVTWSALKALAEDGGLNPRLDLVWNATLADWTPAGNIEGLFKTRATISTSIPNPITSERSKPVVGASQATMWRYYPGCGRSSYLLTVLMLGLAVYLLHLVVDPSFQHFLRTWKGFPEPPSPLKELGDSPMVQSIARILPLMLTIWLRRNTSFDYESHPREHVVAVIFIFVSIIVTRIFLPDSMWLLWIFGSLALWVMVWMTFQRLSNLGMSRWWALAQILPFLNLWIQYRLLACPSGYALSRKHDGIGIALAVLYWLILALGIALTVCLVLS